MTGGTRPVRAVIIGGGMIADVHRRAILLNGGQILGVLSSSSDSTRRLADQWNVTAFDDYPAALASDADVIHVCTPNASHAAYSIQALERGKNVVCEKPLGLTVEDAEAMRAAARLSGLVAAVPFVYRYHPLVRELRDRISNGELGRITLVHGHYLQDWMLDPQLGGWRVWPDTGGRSRAFADIGSHWCDLVEFVTGTRFDSLTAARHTIHEQRPAGSVHAFQGSGEEHGDHRPVVTEDLAGAMLRAADGVLGTVTISQVSAGRKNRLWFEVDGTDGSGAFDQENPETLWLGGVAASVTVNRDPGTNGPDARRLSSLPAGHPQGYAQCFENFVGDVYSWIVTGTRPDGVPTFESGARSARIVDSFLRSTETDAWEPIA